jgi:CHAT domain-containing protein
MTLLEQVAALEDRMMPQVLALDSERQRAAYVQVLLEDYQKLLTLMLRRQDASADVIRKGFDLVARRKGVWIEALAPQRTSLLERCYPEHQPELKRLVALRRQIAFKTLAGPGTEGLATHELLIGQWRDESDRLLAELAQTIPELRVQQQLQTVNRAAIAAALPADTTLIEFVCFRTYDFARGFRRQEVPWGPIRYLAFVLPTQQPEALRIIDLGEAEPIERLIEEFRGGLIDQGEDVRGRDQNTDQAGQALRAALFDKLIPLLQGRRRLLLAPDSELAHVPFEALPTAAGRCLLDDYTISYINAARDLMRIGRPPDRQASEAVVIADVDYDLGAPQKIPAPVAPVRGFWSRWLGRLWSGARPATPELLHEPARIMDATPTEPDEHHFRFLRQPGTRPEGTRIARMLQVQPWLGSDALKDRLVQRPSPRILHLATTGFFLGDPLPNTDLTTQPPGEIRWENLLLRSGLALAGANRHGPHLEEGLLRAREAAGLDLLSTELVAMSSCDALLGPGRTGRSVIGLGRTFILAGARSVLLSLWRTPDRQRLELLEDFYRRLLDGQARVDALRDAKLALKARYADPLYWGAFLCFGDPAPLGGA